MCRPLFFHYESVATALEENLPTPFGMFMEANAKPARGCWHELYEKVFVIVIVIVQPLVVYLKLNLYLCIRS